MLPYFKIESSHAHPYIKSSAALCVLSGSAVNFEILRTKAILKKD
jgi:hypothetical protein